MCGRLALLALPALLLTGGGGTSAPAVAGTEVPPAWQQVIRERDRKRLAGLWGAWTRSLRDVALAGQSKTVAALGGIAVAQAAPGGPLPGPGVYRCRTLKLGSRDAGRATHAEPVVLTMPPAVTCTISERGGLLWFEQGAGAQRIGGRLYPDGERMVFLGSLALAGEMGVMAYGADGERDQVGVLRGLGEGRWRLELPWPMWQANLAIIEIVAT